MKVKVLKDATLTVTAGQVVEISDECATAAVTLGLAIEEKEKPKKKAK